MMYRIHYRKPQAVIQHVIDSRFAKERRELALGFMHKMDAALRVLKRPAVVHTQRLYLTSFEWN